MRRDADSLQMLTQSGIVPLEDSELQKDKEKHNKKIKIKENHIYIIYN